MARGDRTLFAFVIDDSRLFSYFSLDAGSLSDGYAGVQTSNGNS